MASNTRSVRLRAHAPLPPSPEQSKFPARRRAIKRKAPSLRQSTRQSTLTQMDFGTPMMASRETINISSDEDEEFEEPRPKKKSRRRPKFDERDADQSTMTQFDRGVGIFSGARMKRSSSGNNEVGTWKDCDAGQWEEEAAGPEQRQPRVVSRVQGSIDNDGGNAFPLEIPESSQARIKSSPRDRTKTARDGHGVPPIVQTPRKTRFKTEVPSSQTPPSTKSSVRSILRVAQTQRSPLKEKSGNVQPRAPPYQRPESQNISMKMLERAKFGLTNPLVLHDSEDETSPFKIASSQDQVLAPSPTRETRELKRKTTIQDSQQEEGEFSEIQAPGSAELRPRKLERTATVQDSQIEDLDLDIDNESLLHDPQDLADLDGSRQYTHTEDFGPATFDPVHAALERDAARFGQTQTQTQTAARFDGVHEDSETEDEDLGGARMSGEDRSIARIPANPDDEESNETPKAFAADPTAHRSGLVPSSPPPQIPESPSPSNADKSTEELTRNATDNIYIPSSPPRALRPSQISTVVPTQWSPRIPPLPIEQYTINVDSLNPDDDDEPAIAGPVPQDLTILSSPRRLFSLLPDQTLSSSPLPLPPSMHSFGARERKMENSREDTMVRHVSQLTDFSLPPPPPLLPSSSRRGTPASSASR